MPSLTARPVMITRLEVIFGSPATLDRLEVRRPAALRPPLSESLPLSDTVRKHTYSKGKHLCQGNRLLVVKQTGASQKMTAVSVPGQPSQFLYE